MKRRVIITAMTAASVLALVRRAPKRIRKKYVNALVLCYGPSSDAPALAHADGGSLGWREHDPGFGIVAYLQIGWITMHLDIPGQTTISVDSPRAAIEILRTWPRFVVRSDIEFGIGEHDSVAAYRRAWAR